MRGADAPLGTRLVAGTSTSRLPVAGSYFTMSSPRTARDTSTVVYPEPSASHRAGPKKSEAKSRDA